MAINLKDILDYVTPEPKYTGELKNLGLITSGDLEKTRNQSIFQGLLGAGLNYLAQPKTMGYGSAVPYLAKAGIAGLQAAERPYERLKEDVLMKQQFKELEKKKQIEKSLKNVFTTQTVQQPAIPSPAKRLTMPSGEMTQAPDYGVIKQEPITTTGINQAELNKLAALDINEAANVIKYQDLMKDKDWKDRYLNTTRGVFDKFTQQYVEGTTAGQDDREYNYAYLVTNPANGKTYNAVYSKEGGQVFVNIGDRKVKYDPDMFGKGNAVLINTAGGINKTVIPPSKFFPLREDLTATENSLRKMSSYIKTVDSLPAGYAKLANQFTEWFKTMVNSNKDKYTEQEIAQRVAEGNFQGLIGANRLEVVGGGVMTEQDAIRIMIALGGDPKALSTNPEVVARQISTIFGDKYRSYNTMLEDYNVATQTGYTEYQPKAPIQFSDDVLKALNPEIVRELGLKSSNQQLKSFINEQQAQAAIDAGLIKEGETVIVNGQEFTVGEQ